MKTIAPVWKWLLLVALAAVAIALAFHFDAAVRACFTAHRSEPLRHFMRNVSHFGDWPEHVVVGLLVIAIAWWRGSKRWMRVGLTMLLACALAGIVARGTKIATGRARPSVKQELGWNGARLSPKYNSFPSGHTAATIGFFGVLLFVRPRIGLCLLPIPLLIAFSRMYVAAHFLSDVICAAVLGLFCAWLCARWLLPPLNSRRSTLN
jgi:undecaprenyl-diphosphatase